MYILTDYKQPYALDRQDNNRREELITDNTGLPASLPLRILEERCVSETQNFLSGRNADTDVGYELFRRALAQQNEQAWHALMRVYQPMVARWVCAHPSYYYGEEETIYYVNRAFERLWRSVGYQTDKFNKFDSLKALLRFLKMCVHSAVLDDGPQTPPDSITLVEIVDDSADLNLAVTMDLSPLNKGEFWALIDEQLQTTQERVAIYGYFYYGMKNRDLFSQYPDLYRSAKHLSNIRLNVLRRLARIPKFENLLKDFIDDSPNWQSLISC